MRRLIITTCFFGALAAGCEAKPVNPITPLVPPVDAGVVADSGVSSDTGILPDSGVTPDSGVVVDTGVAPARALVEPTLFGTSPLDNRIFGPNFDIEGSAWFGASGGEQLDIKYWTDGPTRQPALRLRGPNGASVLGMFKSSEQALSVSVWLGHEKGGELPANTQAFVLGTGVGGTAIGVELIPVANSEHISSDAVWVKYEAAVVATPIGVGSLLITREGVAPLLLTGPVVITTAASSLRERQIGESGPLTPKLIAGHQALQDQMRRFAEGRDPRDQSRPRVPGTLLRR